MELVQRIDEYGKPAWITIMVLGFILFWPIGLAILGYMIWSRRMGCSRGRHTGERRSMWKQYTNGGEPAGGSSRGSKGMRAWARHTPSSGNRAFDEYRAETMRRLEEEFDEFQDFLDQLRAARDKKEFDQFMKSRKKTVDLDADDEEEENPQVDSKDEDKKGNWPPV